MRLGFPSLIAALLLPAFVSAAEPKRAAGTETIPADGFVVMSVNVAQLWDAPELAGLRKGLQDGGNPMLKDLKRLTGLDLAEIERFTVSMPALPFDPGEECPPILYVTARKPFDRAMLMKGLKAVPIKELRKEVLTIPEEIQGENVWMRDQTIFIAIDDRTFAVTEVVRQAKTVVQLLADLKAGNPAREGPLAEALALAPKHTLVAGIDFAPARKAIAAAGEPEAAELKAVLKATQAERGLLSLDFGKALTVKGKLNFFDAETAVKVEPSVKEIVGFGRALLAKAMKDKNRDAETKAVIDPIFAFAETALGKAESKLDGKVLLLTVGGEVDAALKKSLDAFPAWATVQTERVTTSNNLKQIVLAIHNYESANGFLPSDILDKDGKAILSWRVQLLPYMEQEQIYRKLDLTKPWDDAANKEFLEQMPDVFKVAGRDPKEKGFTYFQSFTADKEIEGGSPFLVKGVKRTIIGITDGSSNTLAVVDGATAVNWMKPGDLVYDPKKLPKVGKDGWMFAAFGDGHVRRLPIPKDDVLKALITINGGEVVSIDE